MKKFPFIKTVAGALVIAGVALAQVPINNLPQATLPLTGNETTIVQQSGTTKQAKVSAIGATAVPAGANTQIQFNNLGAFGANSNFIYNGSSDTLQLGSTLVPGTFSIGGCPGMTISGVALAIPEFCGNSNLQGNVEIHSFTSTSPAAGSFLYGVRARNSITVPQAVVAGDNLLTIGGAGFDGTNYTWGAHIHFLADGAPSAGVLPGAIDFQTTPAGSNTPVSRLFLDHFGAYLVNGSAGLAGQFLTSGGPGAAAGWTTVTATPPGGAVNSSQFNNGGVFGGVTLGTDQLLQGSAGAPQAVSVGNCGSSTQALSYSTATHLFGCQTISAAVTFANPTASLGLTAVNGVATTAMRSDAAPALDQTIAPTWTGTHKWTQSGTRVIPSYWCNGSGPVNDRCWGWDISSADVLRFDLVNDSGVATGVAFSIGNNAGVSDGLTLSATTTAAANLSSTGGSINSAATLAPGCTTTACKSLFLRDGSTFDALSAYGDGGITIGNAVTGGDKGVGTLNVLNGIFLNNVPVLTGNQTITLSGDVTGSGTTAIATTLANSGAAAGSYISTNVTVNAKGIVTAAHNGAVYGQMGGSPCTVGGNSSGIASCSVGATGNYTVTLSPGFTAANTYNCVANAVAGLSGAIASSGTLSATSVNVTTFVSTTATNMQFNLICIGF